MKIKSHRFILSFFCLALAPCSFVFAASPSSIPVSVTGASATPNPALRPTTDETISATISATFTADSGPTTVLGSCQGKTKTNTTTTVSYTDKTLSATANAVSLTGTNGGTWSGPLPLGDDGKTTVSINANASELETTTVVTETLTYPSAPCSGSPSSLSNTDSSTKTITGSASASTSFVTDLAPPTLTLQPVEGQPTVQQGGTVQIHNVLIAGSAGTSYTLTDTVLGPNSYTNSANGTGTFGSSAPAGTGIAPDAHDTVGVHIACDAPVGDYSARAVANTFDLGLYSFDPISSVDFEGPPAGSAIDTFTVIPGVDLEDQTFVVSELPPNGDYAPMSCFTATPSGKKISTFPGSLHITAVVNTTGPCAGFATISGATVILTLPGGFKFDTTGASPAAHVFVFPAASGFDFHYPGPEISLPKSKITVVGQTVTVDLSSVDLGQGAGVIPSSNTIYVRAHAVFSGTSVPNDGTQYVFTTNTLANLSGIGSSTSTSSQTVTKDSTCVDGN